METCQIKRHENTGQEVIMAAGKMLVSRTYLKKQTFHRQWTKCFHYVNAAETLWNCLV